MQICRYQVRSRLLDLKSDVSVKVSMAMSVLRKDQLEAKIKEENQLIRSGVLRDENPLDLSAEFNEFMQACRCADLKRCQELISWGVNINGKDQFDYTPLVIVSRGYDTFTLNPISEVDALNLG